ncbi:hypothetical protein LEL_09016 [Akanthomyces lecanii RCEF 1005]|uniref:Copper transport protein n=1 Tax=Akanthomyces lecanii RCEF 1005 TaxID=1081108 RepID=A0A168CTR9_CORDF|nr:hypothetical protein LEL_09016 [Akanthomyces lecanii RCEF 1005]
MLLAMSFNGAIILSIVAGAGLGQFLTDCILGAAGVSFVKEEPRAWEGHGNENIVQLVHLTLEQSDARFACSSQAALSKSLPTYCAASSPADSSTLIRSALSFSSGRPVKKFPAHFPALKRFKQVLLPELMETYKYSSELRVYEYRPAPTKGFHNFF